MSFLAMIPRNLVRQRIRTGLTLLGISVGITTVDRGRAGSARAVTRTLARVSALIGQYPGS